MFLLAVITIASACGGLASQSCFAKQRLDAHSVVIKKADCADPQADASLSFDSNEGVSFGDILARMNPRRPVAATEETEDLTDTIAGSANDGLTGDIPMPSCQNNTIHANCTCGHSEGIRVGNTTKLEGGRGCPCPDGYYLRDEICVPRNQCGCYYKEEDIIVPEHDHHVNQACISLVFCSDGQLSERDYSCSPEAVCEERDGIRKCYCNEGYTGDGETCTAMDCQAVYDAGNTLSGVYQIRPWSSTEAFDVRCSMTSSGEGWTVFQRRVDGSVDFYRDWQEYTYGFGSAGHEYWLGNERLYYLTRQDNYTLRIDMVLHNDTPIYAEYDSFKINDDKYHIHNLGAYRGNAGIDGFRSSHDQMFTTWDEDNDKSGRRNCAENRGGGWWYSNCGKSNLNSYYNVDDGNHWKSIVWDNRDGKYRHMKYTEMKLLPDRRWLPTSNPRTTAAH